GERIRHAKSELIRSISRLDSDQRFHVIFFNDRAEPMFGNAADGASPLIQASDENKRRAKDWINNQSAESLSDPLPPLETALDIRPDAIFFVTDGELDNPESLPRFIRQCERAKVQFHQMVVND